jgi:hypothetical protein
MEINVYVILLALILFIIYEVSVASQSIGIESFSIRPYMRHARLKIKEYYITSKKRIKNYLKYLL